MQQQAPSAPNGTLFPSVIALGIADRQNGRRGGTASPTTGPLCATPAGNARACSRSVGALLLAVLFVAGASPVSAGMPDVGDEAPSWTLRDVDGDRVRFPDVSRDRPVILLFWGTWCPYCKALMPRLANLKAEFAAHDLEVYAIDFAEQQDPRNAIRAMNLPLGFLREGDAVATEYDINMVPALFLVQDGRVLYRLDYPPADHPSQQTEVPESRAKLLAPWWEERLRGVLEKELAPEADR